MIRKIFRTSLHIITLLCFFGFFVAASSLISFKLLVTGKEIAVPNLIGLRITDALETANKADLNLRLIEKQFHTDIPEGYIIKQMPLPEGKVKSGRPIRITISAGSRLVLIPDMARKSVRQARIILHNSGLEIGNVSKVFSNQEMKGLVLNQDPLPGEEVKRYSLVNLLVSKGPRHPDLVMPELNGLKMELASQILDELGLNIEDIVSQRSDAEEGMVLMQQPLAGSPVSFGDKIRLVISGEEGIIGFKADLSYKVLKYKIPRGFFRKKVKIILDDEAGSREIYNRIMRPNSDLTLTFGIQGPARVRIFIDGRLQEEKIFGDESCPINSIG
ncbi:MAG: PASTA domain-containing protein [Candidatus Ratteibacteria bacterium]|nr:PASTA domain-containing protein [Candidatus Ratteibacteria bacterium]